MCYLVLIFVDDVKWVILIVFGKLSRTFMLFTPLISLVSNVKLRYVINIITLVYARFLFIFALEISLKCARFEVVTEVVTKI
jgi:hypothetical protein